MFRQKLKALDYMESDKVNANDPEHVRKLVIWLEEQRIRHYKIEDRNTLRNSKGDQWEAVLTKYLADVGCPESYETRTDKIEWLVGLAVRLEYDDKYEKYKSTTSSKSKNETTTTFKSTNPLDNLDFQSNGFKKGVSDLAKLLNIPQHPDHLITLEACSIFIRKRLNPAALQNPNSVIVKGKSFPILETEVGYKMKDPVLNNAVKILSLLYIQDLRNLQTQINEAIVSVQNITANPKTDTKLGKVGR